MKKKADVITQINAQEIWKNENTSRIEEQCMSPFIDNVSNDIAEITGYTELEFIDKEYITDIYRQIQTAVKKYGSFHKRQ